MFDLHGVLFWHGSMSTSHVQTCRTMRSAMIASVIAKGTRLPIQIHPTKDTSPSFIGCQLPITFCSQAPFTHQNMPSFAFIFPWGKQQAFHPVPTEAVRWDGATCWSTPRFCSIQLLSEGWSMVCSACVCLVTFCPALLAVSSLWESHLNVCSWYLSIVWSFQTWRFTCLDMSRKRLHVPYNTIHVPYVSLRLIFKSFQMSPLEPIDDYPIEFAPQTWPWTFSANAVSPPIWPSGWCIHDSAIWGHTC